MGGGRAGAKGGGVCVCVSKGGGGERGRDEGGEGEDGGGEGGGCEGTGGALNPIPFSPHPTP